MGGFDRDHNGGWMTLGSMTVGAITPGGPDVTRVPRRTSKPRWLDVRIIGGLLLVLAAVVVGARVVGASSQTTPVWAASKDLATGTVLTAADLVATDVNLGDGALHYLSAGAGSSGSIGARLVTPVRAGELVPVSAVQALAPGRIVVIGVSPERMPPGVIHGSVIDLYLTTGGGTTAADARTDLISAAITVQSVTAPASGGLSGATSNRYQVAVLLPPALAETLVKTLPRGEAIVALVTGTR